MTAGDRALAIAAVAVRAAGDKLGRDIAVVDVSEKLGISEVFVIVSGGSERQVGAIVEEVERQARVAGYDPLHREGDREDPWVLLDFFDTVVHVQHVEARARYGLERLWQDCPAIAVADLPEVRLPVPPEESQETAESAPAEVA